MSPTVIPKNDAFTLPFGGDETKEYSFVLTDEQVTKIVDLAMDAPDFLKVAADFWSKLLGSKDVKTFLTDFLKGIKVSSNPTFQLTGSCKDFSNIKIEWFDPEVPEASVPGVTIEAKPRALDAIERKCKCKKEEEKPGGNCKCRVFTIKWWVKISMKGIVISFLAQLDHITVCSPCCCGEEEAPAMARDGAAREQKDVRVKTSGKTL
jgi:hypothetical protein